MVIDGSFIFIGLIVLAGLLTIILLYARSILFSLSSAIAWVVLSILLLTNQLVKEVEVLTSSSTGVDGITVTSLTSVTSPIFSSSITNLLGYLLLAVAFGCLLYYIGGLGKTKVTMTDSKGQSWQMWQKPPSTSNTESRAQLVRRVRREKMQRVTGTARSRR